MAFSNSILDLEKARHGLQKLYDSGARSIAVVLLHSYTFPDHEIAIGKLAKEIGFEQVSLSSQLLPMIKAISRGHSAAADAYLSPVVHKYVDSFRSGFVGKLENFTEGARCEFMQSDGGLVGWQRFNGLRAILSGPAGGVVGFSRTCYDEDTKTPCIGFDMGGKSKLHYENDKSDLQRNLYRCQQIWRLVDTYTGKCDWGSHRSIATIRHYYCGSRRREYSNIPEWIVQCRTSVSCKSIY